MQCWLNARPYFVKKIWMLLVQASQTPLQCGGSSQFFWELCKYELDSSGKEETAASPGTHSYPCNKQTNTPSEMIKFNCSGSTFWGWDRGRYLTETWSSTWLAKLVILLHVISIMGFHFHILNKVKCFAGCCWVP